jgi:hypothetical protein
LASFLKPLFEVRPLDQAMPALTVGRRPHGRGADSYEDSSEQAIIAASHLIESLNAYPEIQAGLWLYVDELDRSHAISQNLHSSLGAAWHGVMHRREGDFANAKYWFRRAGDLGLPFDPVTLVDQVSRAEGDSPELVQRQRQEWVALMHKSAEHLS